VSPAAARSRPWIACAARPASCWNTIERTSAPNGPSGSRGRQRSGPASSARFARTASRAATSAIAMDSDMERRDVMAAERSREARRPREDQRRRAPRSRRAGE
jgi:hypothetical protein